MSKRGNLPQMGPDGDFNGSGAGSEADDMPLKATAAQLAGRNDSQLDRAMNTIYEQWTTSLALDREPGPVNEAQGEDPPWGDREWEEAFESPSPEREVEPSGPSSSPRPGNGPPSASPSGPRKREADEMMGKPAMVPKAPISLARNVDWQFLPVTLKRLKCMNGSPRDWTLAVGLSSPSGRDCSGEDIEMTDGEGNEDIEMSMEGEAIEMTVDIDWSMDTEMTMDSSSIDCRYDVEMQDADQEENRIKTPRGRLGAGRPAARPAAASPLAGGGSQSNGTAFGSSAFSSNGFNFQSSSANGQPSVNFGSGSTNGVVQSQSGGFSGSIFNLPGQNNTAKSGFAAPSSTPNFFNQTPSMNFGAGPSQNAPQTPSGAFQFGSSSSQTPMFGNTFNTPMPASSQPQTSNLFGTSTSTSQPASTSFGTAGNLFSAAATPQPPATSMFANASTSKPLFGATHPESAATAADSTHTDADMSSSPPQKAPTPSIGQALSQNPSTSLFAAATPKQTPSLFTGVIQEKGTETSPSKDSSAKPATSDLFSGRSSSPFKPASSNPFDAPKSQASTSSLFTSAAPATQAQQPVFNFAPSKSSGATSDTPSTPFAGLPATTSAFAGSAPLFAPKPSERQVNQAPAQNKPLFSATPAASPAKTPLFTFSSSSQNTPAPLVQASSTPLAEEPATSLPGQEPATALAQKSFEPLDKTTETAGNIVTASTPAMSTLNSAPASHHRPIPGAMDIPNVPQPPEHFTREQKRQFELAFKIKVCEAGFVNYLKTLKPADYNKLKLSWNFWLMQRDLYMVELRRGHDIPVDGDVYPPQRPESSAGHTLMSGVGALAAPQTNPFANPPVATQQPTSNNSVFTSLSENTSSRSKRKSDEIGNDHDEDDVPESAKRNRNKATEVSYPSLPEGRSKTSQLFASAAAQPASTPAKSLFSFGPTSSTTPAGSPAKPFASAMSTTAIAPPQFQMPKFGASTGGAATGFASFGQMAAKSSAKAAEEAKQRAMDDELDSDDDAAEWEKRYDAEQAKKKSEFEAISKNASLGFQFAAKTDPIPPKSSFSISQPAINPDISKPATTNPFAASLGSGFNSDGTPKQSASSNEEPTPKATGGLFDRIEKDQDGNAVRDTETAATTAASQTASHPNLFGTTKAVKTTPDSNLLGKPSGAPGAGEDNTYKGAATDKIAFAAPVSSSDAAPFLSITSASPSKTAESNSFALNGSAKPIGSLGSTIFSRSQPLGGGSAAAGLFSAKPAFSATLGPGSIASDTSRATSPGTTGDEATADEAGEGTPADSFPKEAQLDLSTQATAGEEGEEVLFEAKARALEYALDPKEPNSAKKQWIIRGVGGVKLLKNNASSKVRILMRSQPAAKVIINSPLFEAFKYTAEKKTVRMSVPAKDGAIGQWIIMVKEPEDAQKMAKILEENKTG